MTLALLLLALIKSWVILAFVAPPYPPALSTPAGVEREPNSPIWPTLFTEALHAAGQFVMRIATPIASVLQAMTLKGLMKLMGVRTQLFLGLMGVRTQLFFSAVFSGFSFAASNTTTGSTARTASNCLSACKTLVYSVGQIGLLAPLSAPAGVERGGGDRGGIKPQNVKHLPNQNAINRVLTPIIEGSEK